MCQEEQCRHGMFCDCPEQCRTVFVGDGECPPSDPLPEMARRVLSQRDRARGRAAELRAVVELQAWLAADVSAGEAL